MTKPYSFDITKTSLLDALKLWENCHVHLQMEIMDKSYNFLYKTDPLKYNTILFLHKSCWNHNYMHWYIFIILFYTFILNKHTDTWKFFHDKWFFLFPIKFYHIIKPVGSDMLNFKSLKQFGLNFSMADCEVLLRM